MTVPFDTSSKQHLQEFRHSAASIIRDLMAAVKQGSPALLSKADCAAWWRDRAQPSKASVQKLMKNAAKNLEMFPFRFSGTIDSCPAPFDEVQDEERCGVVEVVERIRDLVVEFADPKELRQAANQSSSEALSSRDWEELCHWKSLLEIRMLLNKLPEVGCGGMERHVDYLRVDSAGTIFFRERPFSGATPKAAQLIAVLLERTPSFTCKFEEVMERVWPEDPHSWSALHSANKVSRAFFQKHEIPCTVSASQKAGTVWMKDIPSRNED